MGLFLFCWSVSGMLIPTKDRVAISKHLFEEGVMVAKKDYNAAKHPHVPCRNLYVIKLMQSFKSRGYVTETFSWQWYYWYLTNEGIEFLRGLLGLPEEVIPRTLKPRKTTRIGGAGRPKASVEEIDTVPAVVLLEASSPPVTVMVGSAAIAGTETPVLNADKLKPLPLLPPLSK